MTKVLSNVATTNNYVDSDIASFGGDQGLVMFMVNNSGLSNALLVRMWGSHDRVNWQPLKVETSLAADTWVYETSGINWEHFKLDVKSAVSDTPTTVNAWVINDFDGGGRAQGTLDKQPGVKFVDENGDAYGVKQIDNKPRMSSTPYGYDIAEGNIPNHEGIFIFGHNGTVGTASETVCDQSILMPYLTSAEQLKVSSDSAEDDLVADGDGARRIVITGLDANYLEITETVDMDGAVVVTTDASFLRVHTCYVTTVGVSGMNEGVISIKNNAGSSTLNIIDTGEGYSHSANYTVPADHTFYVTDFYATESSNKGTLICLFRRSLVGGVRLSWGSLRVFSLINSSFVMKPSIPFKITEKTDIEIRATGTLAGAIVTAGIVGWTEH